PLNLSCPISWLRIANMDLLVCEVGLEEESDGFVLGCRGRGDRDDEQGWFAKGYTQEERKDYDEVFAQLLGLKELGVLSLNDSFKRLCCVQMDGKSAFLYGKIEEVYVMSTSRVWKIQSFLTEFIRLRIKALLVYIKTHRLGTPQQEVVNFLEAGLYFMAMQEANFSCHSIAEAEYVVVAFVPVDKYLDSKSNAWLTTLPKLIALTSHIYGYYFMNTKIFIDNEST
ncbi:hypothetical protein Tco_0889180, partial [Tanacetum coccineum]